MHNASRPTRSAPGRHRLIGLEPPCAECDQLSTGSSSGTDRPMAELSEGRKNEPHLPTGASPWSISKAVARFEHGARPLRVFCCWTSIV